MFGLSHEQRTQEKKPMVSPLEMYSEWQRRLHTRAFEQLGEVVDLEGFRDICIGLSDWTTGYQAAFENLTRTMLIPLADRRMAVEEMIEGKNTVVVRFHGEETRVSDFLGVPATARRVSWEAVTIVKVEHDRVVEHDTMLDLWGIYQQLTAPALSPHHYVLHVRVERARSLLLRHSSKNMPGESASLSKTTPPADSTIESVSVFLGGNRIQRG
jgi:predicted ester cyclase